MECIEHNSLSQVIDSPTRGDTTLDLMVTNTKELISDIKTRSSLGFSNHTLVELANLRDKGWARSKVRTLNFREANFQLFKELSQQDLLGNCPQGQGSRTELADL